MNCKKCHIFDVFINLCIISFVFGSPPTQIKSSNQNLPTNVETKSDDIQALVDDAIDWAHNICYKMRTPEQLNRSDKAQFTPFALFPSPIPRKFYEQALAVQKAMSLLYFRISRDFDFLKMAYKDVIQSDRSVRMYMELLEEIKNEGIKQPLSILMQRSDYMITVSTDPQTSEPEYQLRQIEVNGGSIGTAGCIERLATLHRRVLKKSGYSKRAIDNALPDNRSGTALALTIFKAWKQLKDPKAIIVFMVVKANRWYFVHRYDEYELERLSRGRAKIVHLTLAECAEKLTLDDDFTLRLEGRQVGIVYINRVMLGVDYSPKFFAAIRMIERSKAIKASSLFFGMSTSKKIQQMLAMPGMVERFFPDPSEAQMVDDIRNTFAKLWGLENDDEQTRIVIEDAIAHPERYVLKPNKEGGSENFWGQDIADKLKTFTPSERAAHILMERLNPMIIKNYLVFPFKQAKMTVVNNELGIYGYILGNTETGTVLHYEQPGNMLRTKDMQKNEGGVSSGDGVLDSPFLY